MDQEASIRPTIALLMHLSAECSGDPFARAAWMDGVTHALGWARDHPALMSWMRARLTAEVRANLGDDTRDVDAHDALLTQRLLEALRALRAEEGLHD